MRILVADDEHDMARALEAMLKRERYAVDVVYDGVSAYEHGLEDVYDCLVLDIMMPGKDGLEVLRDLRAAGVSTPILLLTAKSAPSDRIHGLNQGADDYLPKPFVMGEFLARVRALTRRAPAIESTVLTAGDLALDRTDFTLSCDGKKVGLANKEYQIMEALMRARGKYLSTERVIDLVWGFGSSASMNVVWVHMSNLRRVLQSIGSGASIVASRGRGYMLKPSDEML